LIFNGFASGSAKIEGLLDAEDVACTAACLKQLGVRMEGDRVWGCGHHFRAASSPLYCGNSGTSIRLLMGLLSGQGFAVSLTGDESLCRRPMERIAKPLRLMGADVATTEGRPPVQVNSGTLRGISYSSPIASAQVKTAVLLAGLQAQGRLTLSEPRTSRDHTERMFESMGVQIDRSVAEDGTHTVVMEGGQRLHASDVVVPGDISSAAFFLVAACISPGSELHLKRVGLNPTRTGVLDVLKRMGARIEVCDRRVVSGEPMGDLHVVFSELCATQIGGREIPTLIDELPILAVAAAFASGETRISDAAELRVKESDRISSTVGFLRAMGVQVEEMPDGMVIEGGGVDAELLPTRVHAGGDHRIAMSAAVAGLRVRGETQVEGAHSIATSFPQFPTILESVRG